MSSSHNTIVHRTYDAAGHSGSKTEFQKRRIPNRGSKA